MLDWGHMNSIEIVPPTPQAPRKSKHGQSYTPEYRIWRGMVNRCHSQGDPAWDSYGGRGIVVCEDWREDFFAFLADMGRRPSPGHEIDRRDNDQGYSRHNCRWVSRKINSRNRRSARMVTVKGETLCLSAAVEKFGKASYGTVQKRISAGWEAEEAVTTPARQKAKNGEAARRGKPQTNSTGFPGVKRRRKGFVGRAVVAGKRRYSKQFETPEEAHAWVVKQREENLLCKKQYSSPNGANK